MSETGKYKTEYVHRDSSSSADKIEYVYYTSEADEIMHRDQPGSVNLQALKLQDDYIVGIRVGDLYDSSGLLGLMQHIGKMGKHISIMYDPERKEKNFTIVINGERLCDCDYPNIELLEYLRK